MERNGNCKSLDEFIDTTLAELNKAVKEKVKQRLESEGWLKRPDWYMANWRVERRETVGELSLDEEVCFHLMDRLFDLRLVGRYPKE